MGCPVARGPCRAGKAVTDLARSMSWLTLLVLTLPLAFVIWRVARMPLRAWLPILGFLGAIMLLQGFDALGGGEVLTVLIYWLAGFGRH